MSDVERQIRRSNIADVALRRIKKNYAKKTKNIIEKENQK